MMRRWAMSILVLALLAVTIPAPAAANIYCANESESLLKYIKVLDGREMDVESRIEQAERDLDAAEERHDELWANAGTDPIDDEAILADIDQLEDRIGELRLRQFDLRLEVEACRRELPEDQQRPIEPHWERVGVHTNPRNVPDRGETVKDKNPTEVREATCTTTENRITIEWKNVDPRDEKVLSELQFAYNFQKPPKFMIPGKTAELLEIEATVTGEHHEGAVTWTSGAYGGGLVTLDRGFTAKPPVVELIHEQYGDKPTEAYLDFSIFQGRQTGVYFLWAYVDLAGHSIERCDVAWEYNWVE